MAVRRPLDAGRELLEAFEHSGRVTEYLVAALPRRLWRAEPPAGQGRPIAAIVAHMQGVRRTFAKMGRAGAAVSVIARPLPAAEAISRCCGDSFARLAPGSEMTVRRKRPQARRTTWGNAPRIAPS
jgi:hypothetical protein